MDYFDIPGLSFPVSNLVMGSVSLLLKNQERSNERLDAYVESGGNIVDTGRIYGGGESERAIGNWLASRGIRDEFMVLTKGCHPHGQTRRVTSEALESDVSETLKALQTDRIDIYLMHRDDPVVPVGEIMGWLNDYVSAGSINVLGASNWTQARVQAANEYAIENGLSGFKVVSNYAGLAATNEPMWWECLEMDADYCNWLAETGIPNFCWSSLSHGFFSRKLDSDDPEYDDMVRTYGSDRNRKRLQRASEFGRSRNLNATQVACAYVLSQKYPSLAVVSPENLEELNQLVEASALALGDDEIEWLEGS